MHVILSCQMYIEKETMPRGYSSLALALNSWYRLRRSIPLLLVLEPKGNGNRGAYCRNLEVNSASGWSHMSIKYANLVVSDKLNFKLSLKRF